MTDAEMRPEVFRHRLDQEFADEPPLQPTALYEAAGRRRVRRGRSAIAAGCVLAAVVVPAAAVGVADGLGGGGQVPLAAERPEIPADWQVERGAGVTFSVPPDWEPGDQSQWCIRGAASPPPLVFIEGEMASTQVACASPVHWFGATLAPTDMGGPQLSDRLTQYEPPADANLYEFPPGSWGVRVDAPNGWSLSVVAPTRETAQLIVSSLSGDGAE